MYQSVKLREILYWVFLRKSVEQIPYLVKIAQKYLSYVEAWESLVVASDIKSPQRRSLGVKCNRDVMTDEEV